MFGHDFVQKFDRPKVFDFNVVQYIVLSESIYTMYALKNSFRLQEVFDDSKVGFALIC